MLIAQDRKTQADSELSLACWCGQPKLITCFRRASFGLVRCTECGCYRIDPPAVVKADGLGDFYTTYYGSKQPAKPATDTPGPKTHHTSRFWRVAARVPELRRPLKRALDIGCGDGKLCSELRDEGWGWVGGLDLSKSRIARASALYPNLEFFDVPLERTGLPKNSIDLAVLDNVIEHVPDPVEQIVTIRKHLRAGSHLVLITPNMESGNFRLLRSFWSQELAPHVHIFLFTEASLSRLAVMAGYQVRYSGSFHLDRISKRQWFSRLAGGDLKGAAWSAVQGAGNLYSRILKSGPMLYVVARVPETGGES